MADFIVPFRAAPHLAAVMALLRAEGWSSYSDPHRVVQALTAPGVVALVAMDAATVVGVVQFQGDGVIQAHLSLLVVAAAARNRGCGRRLVEEAFRRSGAQRLDLLAEPAAAPFYERFAHRGMPGYRIYPGDRGLPGPSTDPAALR